MIGLIPFIGNGTRSDPFRPDAWDGSGYLDLRPPGQSAGFALVEQPVIVPIRRIANALDDVLGITARAQLTALGFTPSVGATVREAIVDLFLAPPLTLRIGRLLPTVHGRHEIMLRGVPILSLPVISGGATVTESFNKADAATLGPDQTWTEFESTDWGVVSNQANVSTSTADQSARADVDLATADHYCQASVTTSIGTTPDRFVGTLVRKDSTSTRTYYLGQRSTFSGATNNYDLYKRVAGTFTQLATLAENEPGVPYTLRTEINGSTLRLLIDGVEKLNVTDTAVTGNTRCGILGGRTAGAVTLDVWEAGDLAAAATHPGWRQKGGWW